MLEDFKKTYMKNIFEQIKATLVKISEEQNIPYEELEEIYLKDIKDFFVTNQN